MCDGDHVDVVLPNSVRHAVGETLHAEVLRALVTRAMMGPRGSESLIADLKIRATDDERCCAEL